MKPVISNSVINVGSTIHGSVTNTVSFERHYDDAISDLHTIITNHASIFSKGELMALREAKDALHKQDLPKVKQVLYYFKNCLEDIMKLSLSGALVDLITGI